MQTVLIDVGSTKTRLGLAGDYKPSAVLPSIYGKPRHQGVKAGLDPNAKFYGDQLAYKKQLLKPHAIMSRALVDDFDDFYDFTRFCIYDELRLDPSDVRVFCSCNCQTSREDIAKITRIMFEQFNVKGFFVLNSLVLSMYSSGSLTGLVLEVGDSYQQACPVYQGFLLKHALRQNIFAGKDLSAQLVQQIKAYNKEFNEDADLIAAIKQTLFTYDAGQLAGEDEVLYQLPDGFLLSNPKCHNIVFNKQRLLGLPEQLFSGETDLRALVLDSIASADEDLRDEMAANVVLAGGTTMIKGFPGRLGDALGPGHTLHLPEDRQDACFNGMSVLSTLPTFADMVVTPQMWSEFGDDVVSLKWL